MANPYPGGFGGGHLWGGLGGVRCTSPMMWARETYTVGPLTKAQADAYVAAISSGAGFVSICPGVPEPYKTVAGVVSVVTTVGGYYWVKYTFPPGCEVRPAQKLECGIDICKAPLQKAERYVLLGGSPYGKLGGGEGTLPSHCKPPPARRDPLVLDLDGNGINTSGWRFFDFNSDGFAESTGWVGGEDGVLVLDVNGDGYITNGKELFGDETLLSNGAKASNGFEALAQYDANKDGIIDAADPIFQQLKIMKNARDDSGLFPDLPDGYFTVPTLFSLDEFGITSISLSSTPDSFRNEYGDVKPASAPLEQQTARFHR